MRPESGRPDTARWRVLRAALLVVITAVAGGAATGVAQAASRTVTMTIDDASGQARLVPSSLTVSPGDIVVFRNNGRTAYTVSIPRDGYQAFLVPNQSSDNAGLDPKPYTAPKKTGSRAVNVTSVTGTAGKSGSITVAGPAPTSSPSPAAAPASSKPTPAATRATQLPVVAPPPRSRAAAPPLAVPTLSIGPLLTKAPPGGSQPLVAPTPLSTLSPTAAPIVAASGPLEAPTGRGVGLPAALAVVLIAGGIGAIVRVLLAEPVDGGRRAVGVTG